MENKAGYLSVFDCVLNICLSYHIIFVVNAGLDCNVMKLLSDVFCALLSRLFSVRNILMQIFQHSVLYFLLVCHMFLALR